MVRKTSVLSRDLFLDLENRDVRNSLRTWRKPTDPIPSIRGSGTVLWSGE